MYGARPFPFVVGTSFSASVVACTMSEELILAQTDALKLVPTTGAMNEAP